MNYYMAPLEGITTFIYRTAHAKCYGALDKYITPFASPAKERSFTERELLEFSPLVNESLPIVPQLMISRSDLCVRAVKELAAMGFSEVNLNFGCPSGVVTRKKKGSGMLRDLAHMERFLDEVYAKADAKVSIKTRIGYNDPAEFEKILEVLRKFPISELIIHPRIRQEFYKGQVHLEAFGMAAELLAESGIHLVYNGDVFAREDVYMLTKKFPKLDTIMFGRGILRNPNLVNELQTQACAHKYQNPRVIFAEFLNLLKEGYLAYMPEERIALELMKRLWTYMKDGLKDRVSGEILRKVFLAEDFSAYDQALAEILEAWKLYGSD